MDMKEKISSCVRDLEPSVIRQMWIKAAQYDDVISLGIGESDFDTPGDVCESALSDALAGHTHYTPSQGYPELLDALVDSIKRRWGIEITRANILVTHGGMGAINGVLRTILEPGQEVLVPEPHFPTYKAQICFVGGKIEYVPTRYEDGFIPSPETIGAAITPRTKLIIINTPNNPTGAVIPGEVLDEIARIAVDHDLLVLSDEVYDRLVFNSQHESIYTRPGMSERTVVVNSFSKAFAMTGWRMGYAYGPPWLMEEMLKVVTYQTSCASSIGQRAALQALRSDDGRFEAMAKEFHKRCDLVYRRMRNMPGIRIRPTAGSFYAFPDVSDINPDSKQFAFDLLDRERVIVIPGTAFGPSGRGFVRIACTVDQDRLTEAMDRIERFVSEAN